MGYSLLLWLIHILIQTPPVSVRHLEGRCAFTYLYMSPRPRGRFTFWFQGISAAVKTSQRVISPQGGVGLKNKIKPPNALLQVWAEQAMQNRGVSQSRAELKIKLHDLKLFERSLRNALMRVLKLHSGTRVFDSCNSGHLVWTLMSGQISAALALALQAATSPVLSV